MASVARNTLIDSAAQIGGNVLSLIAGILLARYLGDEGRGQYVYATTFAGQLLFSLVNLGMELSCSSIIGRARNRLSEIHSLVICWCAFILLGGLATAWLFHDSIRTNFLPGLTSVGLMAIAVALPFWIYQSGAYGMLVGLGAVRTRALFDVGFNLMQSLGVVLLLVYTVGDQPSRTVQLLTLAYYAVIIAGAISLGALLVSRGARWKRPAAATAREFLSFGGLVWGGNLGSNVGQRIDQYMVERVGGGLSAFGVYTLAVSLAQRTQIFPQALTRSVYARLGTGSLDEAADLSARCFRQMLVLGVLLVIAGAMASPLIPLVYTAEFSGAVLPFIIFLVGRLFANCGWMLANFFTAHLGRPAIPMIATWGIVPMQGLGAWWAVGTGSLTLVAGAMAACNLVLMIAFIILFLRAQKSVGLGRLLIVGTEDLAPWRAIIARLFGRRSV